MIDKRRLISYVNSIDSKLKGYTKKINMYCVGGTALTLRDKKILSYDMDFAVSREDFRTLSGIIAEIEWKEKVRIDLMPEGEHVDYFLPYDYQRGVRKIGLFKNINLFIVSDLDLVLMKALAGRPKDYKDTEGMIGKINKNNLLRRFEQLKFKEGKKESLKRKLDEFIASVYAS